MPITNDAQDLLGAGFAPRPRLFTPVDLGGGLSAEDKYRHVMQTVQESNVAQKMLDESTHLENSYLKAERGNQAMRQEADVLSELNKLDPLDAGFEQVASQFSQFASVSPAVERALNLKMQQRSGYNQALGALAQSGIEAGMDEATFASQQQTAQDMLRRGDLAGYRSLLARSQRLAKSTAESNALRMLRKEGRVKSKIGLAGLKDELELREDYSIQGEKRREKAAIRGEDRANEKALILARQKALIEAGEDRTEAIREFRGKMADIATELPSDLLSDQTELSPGYTVGQWIADPFGAPENFKGEPTVFSFEGVTNGEYSVEDIVAAGIGQEEAEALAMGQADPIEIPNFMKAEDVIAQRVVDQQVRKYVVGDGKTPRIEGFAGLEKLVENLPEKEAEARIGEFIDMISAGVVSMDRDSFIAAFSLDKRGEEVAELRRLEEAGAQMTPEQQRKQDMMLFLDGMGITPSSRAAKFAGGLHDTVQAVRKMSAEKKKFRFAHPDLEMTGAALDEERKKQNEAPEKGASTDDWTIDDWIKRAYGE